ncbi:unnamed protein product, partial [Ostreobium quekettii]
MLGRLRSPPGLHSGRPAIYGCVHQPKCPPRPSSTVNDAVSSARAASPSSDLFKWLQEAGTPVENIDIQSVRIGGKDIDKIVAARPISAGELAISVPERMVVTLDAVFEDEAIAELLTTNKLSELACLTLYLMYEKKEGKQSFWYPYIKELDRLRARGQSGVESPILWPQEEAERLLAGSTVLEAVMERKAGILDEYQECDTVWYLAGSLFNKYPYDIPTEAFSSKLFLQ